MTIYNEQLGVKPEMIPLPEGWTELIHGTDSARWGANDQIKRIASSSLSVIEAVEMAREQAMLSRNPLIAEGAYDTTRNYARPSSPDAVSTEVRVIAPCPELARSSKHIPDNLKPTYDVLSQEQKDALPNYYLARHPVVPAKELIIKIGEHDDERSGRKVLTYIPNSFAAAYTQTLEATGETAAAEVVRHTVAEAQQYIANFGKEVETQKRLQTQGNERLKAANQRVEAAKGSQNPTMFGIHTAYLEAVQRRQQELIREQRLLRPSSPEDAAYRMRVLQDLPGKITAALPADSPIRFHATSLLATENVIQMGELSSSVDRTGQATSYDTSDQVSVTIPKDVAISVSGYLGLTERNMCLPAGCIFMLLPRDATEAAAGAQMLMGNVYFRDHPEQLVGILTSDENIPTVRAWCVKAGLDPKRVQEFFTGVEQLASVQKPPIPAS